MSRFIIVSIVAATILSCNSDPKGGYEENSQDTTNVPVTSSRRITVTDTLDLNPDEASPEKRSPQNGDTVRFMVAFISKGFGIDNAQKANLDQWLVKQNVQYSVSPWGREGEMNYCFPLKNISPDEQREFINDLKSQITKRDLVYFYENTSCSK